MTALETLLDDTRAALLEGDVLRLATLADAVAAADPPRDGSALRRSRQKADRNARLLLAAMKGLRAARRRADEIGRREGFATYDSRGGRDSLAQDRPPRGRF